VKLAFNFSVALAIVTYPKCIMNGRMASWAFFLTSALRSSTFAYKCGKHINNSSLEMDLGDTENHRLKMNYSLPVTMFVVTLQASYQSVV
jgi:hypothetical protein